MKKTLLLIITIFLPLGIFLSGCGNKATDQKETGKLTIYTTVYPLQYFAERIGGSLVKVDTIYPPGSNEHTFDPSQKDMMKLVDADLFFYIGLGLEGFVEKSKKTFENGHVEIVATAEHLDLEKEAGGNKEEKHADEEDENDEHGHDHAIDPHVWLDPVYAKELAMTIANTLSEAMPEKKAVFEENYQKLADELQSLDENFAQTLKGTKHNKIVVAHAAYGYWEKRYGIEQVSVAGLSTTNEPSQKKLEQIIDQIKQEKIKYIFFEQNVQSKITEVVQKEIGAKTLTLHNLSVLTPDDIKNKETYFTLMEKNLKALEKALTL